MRKLVDLLRPFKLHFDKFAIRNPKFEITSPCSMLYALCFTGSFALRMHMNISLWEGNDNTFPIKRFIDLPIQFVNYPSLVVGPMGPAQELKIKG